MIQKARRLMGSGSAVLAWLLFPLMNERGEAGEGGVQPILPGTEDAAALGNDDAGGGADTFYQPADDSFSARGAEQQQQPEGEQPPDTGKKPNEQQQAQQAPREQPGAPTLESLQEQVTQFQSQIQDLTGQLEQQRTVAEFYANQYNEALGFGPDGQPVQAGMQDGRGQQAQGQAPQPPGNAAQLPENIKPPEQWDSQSDEAAYIDHHVGSLRNDVNQVYQQEIVPTLQSYGKAIQGFQSAVAMMDFVMSQMPNFQDHQKSYNDLMKSAEEEVFTFDPGGRVIGVKNQALLNYFRAQPNPRKAMLDHAMARKAPQNIQQGVRKGTEAVLRNIVQQPKGPTMPKGGGQQAPVRTGPPPQTAKGAEVERYLGEAGLI